MNARKCLARVLQLQWSTAIEEGLRELRHVKLFSEGGPHKFCENRDPDEVRCGIGCCLWD
jgi:hypothetical protein